MAPAGQAEELVAAIYNACWWLRNCRGRRGVNRDQAIQKLGIAVRHAFQESENFEPLLAALIDGLNPRDDLRF